MSPAVEQDFSLTQGMLASRKNSLVMANMIGASGILNSIEEDSGRRTPALAGDTLLKRPERRLK